MILTFFVIVPVGNNGRFGTLILFGHRERGVCPRILRKRSGLVEIQPTQMGLAGMPLSTEARAEFVAEGHPEYDEPAIVCYRFPGPKSARMFIISYGQIATHPRFPL